MSKYEYSAEIRKQIERLLRGALSMIATQLRLADKAEDFGGIDLHYWANDLPIQVRSRFDRPHNAHTQDVTFRATEPSMIDAGTYAPLVMFTWFWGGIAGAAHLVDPYGAHKALDIRSYTRVFNHDDTSFYPVPMGDLLRAESWLRHYDGQTWSTICTGGLMRVQRMLTKGWNPPQAAS